MRKFLFFSLISILAACSPKGSVYLINSSQTNCEGKEPTTCLQLTKTETLQNADWQTCDGIQGFDFVPGYFYKLRLLETVNGNQVSYKMLELLEKTPDPKFALNGKWIVTKIGDTVVSFDDENKQAFLFIDLTAMGISGNDGCNNLNSQIVLLDDSKIEFGPIAATRMFCPDMSVADPFNAALVQVKKYRIEKNALAFQNKAGDDLVFLSREK